MSTDSEALEDRVDHLEDVVESLQEENNQLVTLLQQMIWRVCPVDDHEIDDRVEMNSFEELRHDLNNFSDEIETLQSAVREANDAAGTALGVAKSLDEGARADGSPSKVDVARWTSRNEIVRRTIEGGAPGGATIETGEVREMARPQHDLEYMTVDRAWKKLEQSWRSITVEESTDDKPKRLVLDGDNLEESLIGVVARELGKEWGPNNVVRTNTSEEGNR